MEGAGFVRSEEWTSVHDEVMTPGCGQTAPARRVVTERPPCSGEGVDQADGQRCRQWGNGGVGRLRVVRLC